MDVWSPSTGMTCRHRLAYPGHRGHGLSDRLHHRDGHGHRRDATVRAGGSISTPAPTTTCPYRLHASRASKPILGETVTFGQWVPTLAEFYGFNPVPGRRTQDPARGRATRLVGGQEEIDDADLSLTSAVRRRRPRRHQDRRWAVDSPALASFNCGACGSAQADRPRPPNPRARVLRRQRAVYAGPPCDRAMPAVVVLAGAHLAETVGLDLDGLPTTQRRCRLRVRGQGRRTRSVPAPLQPPLGLDACIARRRTWPGA